MAKKKNTPKPNEFPIPDVNPDIKPIQDPEEPLIPEFDPDYIPDEDPDDPIPFEIPTPGEGP